MNCYNLQLKIVFPKIPVRKKGKILSLAVTPTYRYLVVSMCRQQVLICTGVQLHLYLEENWHKSQNPPIHFPFSSSKFVANATGTFQSMYSQKGAKFISARIKLHKQMGFLPTVKIQLKHDFLRHTITAAKSTLVSLVPTKDLELQSSTISCGPIINYCYDLNN